MPTYVYIDGFNLYYGAVKGTPHRWLDLEALCRQLLPNEDIGKDSILHGSRLSSTERPRRPC